MPKGTKLIIVAVVFLFSGYHPSTWRKIEWRGNAQGTSYHIICYTQGMAPDSLELTQQFGKLDQRFSRYREGTTVSNFNQSSRGIQMDSLFKDLIRQSFRAHQETGGISDITVLPLIHYWQQQGDAAIPDSKQLQSIRACTGMQYLKIKGDSLVKDKACIMIDLDGIAQGYSVDYLCHWLEQKGINNYMVEIGGELRTNGHHQPSGDAFRISIEVPGEDDWSVGNHTMLVIPGNAALTTSGNYRKFIGAGMNKRSHIIDPRKGKPAQTDLVSVTVYAANATLADAYDNALLAMGLKKAMMFVNRHPEIAAHFIYRNPLGEVKDTCTAKFLHLKVAPAR